MLKLIPQVKYIEEKSEYLTVAAISSFPESLDSRIEGAIKKLPTDKNGVELSVEITGTSGEEYEISITHSKITLVSSSPRAAFWGVQTLRQIFNHSRVPLLFIKDFPDLEYRGFYQDVTRGKIPKVETLKRFIDILAHLKYNSFQIYVEHVYDFEEYSGVKERTGYYTAEEIRELDEYCCENFIEFIPSLSCFGHLYELLETERYKHLRCKKDYVSSGNRWSERAAHHTLDPRNPESFEVVRSMIDAYYPIFKSDKFNVCCDETFDLKELEKDGENPTLLYAQFVSKIVRHLQSRGKKVMMWGDVVRDHPEIIKMLPDNITYINWNYNQGAKEEAFSVFQGVEHMTAPSVCSQLRLCEAHHYLVPIIKKAATFGRKFGAIGMLNTNWGDWGNPASLDMALYGVSFGGAVAWDTNTDDNDAIHSAVNLHVYKYPVGYEICVKINEMHRPLYWHEFVKAAISYYNGEKIESSVSEYDVGAAQRAYKNLITEIPSDGSDLSQEMKICVTGICVMYEHLGLMKGYSVERVTSTREWLESFSAKWREKNKEGELSNIIRLIEWLSDN